MNINEAIALKITQSFIDGLKLGRIPWKREWKNGTATYNGKWSGFVSESVNVQTGKHYNGINALLLDSLGLELPVWGTYNQWKFVGCPVMAGSKGTPTIFWSVMFFDESKKFLTLEQYNGLSKEKQAKCTKAFKLRYDTLFHIEQATDGNGKLDNIRAKWTAKIGKPETVDPTETIETVDSFRHNLAETIVERWGITLKHESQDRAYYAPMFDTIMMPMKEQFDSPSAYYETLFHEGGHATGHAKRLGRKSLTEYCRFGSKQYSEEELVAEITSAYVCAHLGIEQHLENKQAYINNWIAKLGENPDWIIKASSAANKAAGWILGWLDGESGGDIGEGDEQFEEELVEE